MALHPSLKRASNATPNPTTSAPDFRQSHSPFKGPYHLISQQPPQHLSPRRLSAQSSHDRLTNSNSYPNPVSPLISNIPAGSQTHVKNHALHHHTHRTRIITSGVNELREHMHTGGLLDPDCRLLQCSTLLPSSPTSPPLTPFRPCARCHVAIHQYSARLVIRQAKHRLQLSRSIARTDANLPYFSHLVHPSMRRSVNCTPRACNI